MREIPAGLVTTVEAAQNQPVELYELYLDDATYRYAASDNDIVFGGNTYEALGIQRTPITTHLSEQIDQLSIGLDNVNKAFVPQLVNQQFNGRRCRILKVFRDQLADPTHYVVLFDGRMDQPSVVEQILTVRVVSYLDLLHKDYPGRVFSTQCNYKLYDTWCTVNRSDPANRVTGTVAAGSTSTRIIAAVLTQADDYWQIGTIKFTSGALNRIGREVRISRQSGTYVEVRVAFPSAPAVGDAFEIVRGCNKTESDCVGKFNNWPNYGGFNHIPKPIIPLAAMSAGGGGGKGGGGK